MSGVGMQESDMPFERALDITCSSCEGVASGIYFVRASIGGRRPLVRRVTAVR